MVELLASHVSHDGKLFSLHFCVIRTNKAAFLSQQRRYVVQDLTEVDESPLFKLADDLFIVYQSNVSCSGLQTLQL